jgi:rhodanese-related sulfurtransferase
LQAWIHDGEEIALLDVREFGQFGQAHPFFAVNVPYSRLEIDARRLVPRTTVRTVLVDQSEETVHLAASRLEALDFDNLFFLRGGVQSWAESGLPLFEGVNVASKAFGELVQHAYGTPSMGPHDLARMLRSGDAVTVLDGRPFPEYRKMSIPRSLCCPNGELALRIESLIPDPTTTIVVNCAGRTRSIIGAQTLRNLGVPNPVFALEDGTQGWSLAGLELEHGQTNYVGVGGFTPTERIRTAAKGMASEAGVVEVDARVVEQWRGERERTIFLLDVRSPEEFQLGSSPAALSAPGGQLVQATDQYVGVRGARLVLVDDDGVRASVIGSWLSRMGYETFTLPLLPSGLAADVHRSIELPRLAGIRPERLGQLLREELIVLIDLRKSMDFRARHIPGSRWSIRPQVAKTLTGNTSPVVFVADEPVTAQLAALELDDAQRDEAMVLLGGFPAWVDAGLPVSSSSDTPPDSECIDFLFFAHDRHEGNAEAARRYLAWERSLVARLNDQDRGVFRLPG